MFNPENWSGFGAAGNDALDLTLGTISSGSHVPWTDEEWEKIKNKQAKKPTRYVVWGNNSGATNGVIVTIQEGGGIVVERTRLQEIFDEQKIRLTHTPEDDANILKVGKLTGADFVVFVEVTDRPEVRSGASFGPYGGGSQSQTTVYHLSVAVRAVKVDTGEIRWSGRSALTDPISNPEANLSQLTQAAMSRARCPLERGYEWIEMKGSRAWGCTEKK